MKKFILEKKERLQGILRGTSDVLDPLRLIEERQALKVAIKESEAKLTICEDKLKGLLGEEETLVVGNKLISWKRLNRKVVSLTDLREENREVYNKYLKEYSYRKFEVKNI